MTIEYIKDKLTLFYTLHNGGLCYGLPSKRGGWTEIATIHTTGTITIAGSCMRPACATPQEWGYWKRYVSHSIAPEHKENAKQIMQHLQSELAPQK